MAEALLRREAGDRFNVYSAGTAPKGIHPLTVQVMNEVGLDISSQRSKQVSEYVGWLPVRYLVVVCGEADRNCPAAWPGVYQRLYWPFDDPAAATGSEEARLAKFREVRDAIDAKIKQWLAEEDRVSRTRIAVG